MSDELEAQRRLKIAILERVQDLGRAEHLAYALIETGFDIIAGQHRPAELTPADRAAIQDNYADATPKLIASRAVDEVGLAEVIGVAETYARIYIDYSPLSHWKTDLRQDEMRDAGLAEDATELIDALHERWLAAGVSQFGICCVLVLTTVQVALRRGMAWPKIVRICLDAIQMSRRGQAGPPPEFSEAEILKEFAERVGISKAAARKFMALVKAGKVPL
jgi:hypothetical protein